MNTREKFKIILILFIIMIIIVKLMSSFYMNSLQKSSGETYSIDYELDEDGFNKKE